MVSRLTETSSREIPSTLGRIRTCDPLVRNQVLYPLSHEGAILAGRQGFEPWVELLAPQPLSRRPQSSTLAPPRTLLFRCFLTPLLWRRERDSNPR